MTPNQKKEEISRAYVAAVAASQGLKVGAWSIDDGCLDMSIAAPGVMGKGHLAGPQIALQLKCTSDQKHDRSAMKSKDVWWDLKADHYQQLIQLRTTPLILVLLVLPEKEPDWITVSTSALTIRRCAWWICLQGEKALKSSAKKKRVKIPAAKVFNGIALGQIMEKVSSGKQI